MTITLGQYTPSSRVTIEEYNFIDYLSADITAVATAIPLANLGSLIPATSTSGNNATIVINPDTHVSETIDTWTGGTITGATRASTAYAASKYDIVEVTLSTGLTNKAYVKFMPGEKVILYIDNNSTGTTLSFQTKPRVTRRTANPTWFQYVDAGASPALTTISLVDSQPQTIPLDLAKCDGELEITVNSGKNITLDVGFDTLVPINNP